jgi:DNA processing protein
MNSNSKLYNELKLWLIPKIGSVNFDKICNYFHNDLEEFFKKPFSNSLKLPKESIEFLKNNLYSLDRVCEKEFQNIEKNNIKILKKNDKLYPKNLIHILYPPPLLFIKGNIEKLSNKSIAIVGTRQPSQYGIKIAKKIAGELALNRVTIVSGLATGIDSVAHKSALLYGDTIAVIGSGFKYIYPAENKKLYAEILEKNTIISEYPFDVPPDRFNFPNRNRLISGLSEGVLIVEANEKSGSLITAMHALDQGKDIFAIPGEITNPKSVGTNRLIRDGAKIVLSVDDILEEIIDMKKKLEIKEKQTQEALNLTNNVEKVIYNIILEKRNLQFDEIANYMGDEINVTEVMNRLLTLQLKGLIIELPGKYYSIK